MVLMLTLSLCRGVGVCVVVDIVGDDVVVVILIVVGVGGGVVTASWYVRWCCHDSWCRCGCT